MTVGGLGERAGNACLAEVAAALESLQGLATGLDLARLSALAERVGRASGRAVPEGKAIVGRDVFAHESGIHVAGLLVDPETYRGADPKLFGRRHRIVIGKHSGAKALAHALAGRGVELAPPGSGAPHSARAAEGDAPETGTVDRRGRPPARGSLRRGAGRRRAWPDLML